MAENKQTRGIGIYINGEEVANQFKSITAAAALLKNEIALLEMGTEEYNAKALEIQKVNALIKEHYNNLRPMQGTWEKLKTGAMGFAAVAGIAFGTDQIVDYGKQLFKSGIELETLQKKAETVFGETLPQATQSAKEHAAAMGLTQAQYIASAAAAQDLLVPMGFQRKAATDISLELVDLSGALSEWTGGQKSSQEVSSILTKALLGEREEMKQLGIAISENDVKNRLAAEGHDKLTGKALEQAKAHATLQLIIEKSTDAQAAFANNSESAIRRQAELAAKISQIGENLAKLFLPVLNEVADVIGGAVDMATEMTDAIEGWTNPSKHAVEAFKSQADSVRKLESDISPLLDRYDKLKSKSNLSTAEQAELKKIIEKVAGVIPTAVQGFDSYGRALGLNTDKARDFIQMEQARLKFLNKSAIDELELAKKKLEFDKKFVDERLAKGGQNEWTWKLGVGTKLEFVESDAETVKKLQSKASGLQKTLDGMNAQLLFLKGEQVSLPQPMTPDGSGDGNTDTGAAEKRADRLKKLEEDLQQKLNEIRAAYQLDGIHEEEARAIEAVQQKYQKELEAATTGEFKNVAAVKALVAQIEGQKEQDLDRIRAEFSAKKLAADEAFFAEQRELRKKEAQQELADAEESANFLQKRDEERKSAQTLINEFLAADQRAKEILELEEHYAELLQKAEDYGLNVTGIKEAWLKKQAEINAKYNKEEVDKQVEAAKKRAEALEKSFNALSDLATATYDLMGEKGQDASEFGRSLALFKIAIDTASAISSLTAASEANPANALTFGAAGAAQFIAGLARIVSNIAKAKELLTEPVPQKFEGGYHDVTGQTDGKKYRAESIGRPETGMLPNHPTLVLASEKGAEYFVAAEQLRNPVVANYVRMIDNIAHSRTEVPQFAEGGATRTIQVPIPSTGGDPLMSALLTTLNKLNDRLDQPFYAVLPDRTIVSVFQRFEDINSSSGNYFQGK